jgi:thiamine biosynthesis lipoprotein
VAERARCADHAVNGGGDVQLAGRPEPGREWTVGIADPAEPGRVLTTVTGSTGFAVATSGTAERGAHLVDPFTGRPVTHLASATVTGPSLTRADAYATAAFVLGPAALDWIATRPGYAALLVDPLGRASRTPDFPADQADWLMFTNQFTPKRSVHMPNSSPHTCFSSGIPTVPPSHSFSQ